MRILELTDLYRPVIGGVPRYVEAISRSLSADGHAVAVATSMLPQTGTASGISEDGVATYRLTGWHHAAGRRIYHDIGRPHHPPFPDPGYARALNDVIRHFRPDVVHAHNWSIFSLLPLLRWSHVPVLSMSHAAALVCARQTMIRPDGASCEGPGLTRCPACAASQYGAVMGPALTLSLRASARLLRRVDRFVAVSSFVAAKVGATITPYTGRPVTVLHPCVPDGFAEHARSARRPAFVPASEYLLYVGVIARHKGIDVLLAAHERLGHCVPLVLVGALEGDCLSANALPPNVFMAGGVSSAEVAAAMAHATAVVVPSTCDDAFPTTVTEAQLAGAPLVASAVGGIPEQVRDGETAILVPRGDAGRLAAALGELLGDPERRRGLGAAAAIWGRRFTASALLPATVAALSETIASSTQTGRGHSRRGPTAELAG